MRHALVLLCLILHTLAAVEPPEATALRRMGPAGLDELGRRYDHALALGAITAGDWDATFAAVAQQRYAREARLFWYTDLDAAAQAARASGRPILSLRLLGRLTDEASCANSRFFRVVLYPDPTLRGLLRDEVILHWSSERPVPQVTIDFGDGRVLRTTITGNSCHYLLDAEGRVLDALPGLIAPTEFAKALRTAIAAPRDGAARAGWHAGEGARLDRARALAFARVPGAEPQVKEISDVAGDAEAAGMRAMSKRVVEQPLLRALRPERAEPERGLAAWKALGQTRLPELSAPSLELFLRLRGVSDYPDLDGFLASLASDTARNELDYHARLHRWLADAPTPAFAEFNARVYRELFLTPADDPWLGLNPRSSFNALPDSGIVTR